MPLEVLFQKIKVQHHCVIEKPIWCTANWANTNGWSKVCLQCSAFNSLNGLISFLLGADITPTWGCLLYTHILIDRSLWRQSLTTHSMRLEAWVLLLLIPLYIAHHHTHTHAALTMPFKSSFSSYQETREYEVSIWKANKKTFCTETDHRCPTLHPLLPLPPPKEEVV